MPKKPPHGPPNEPLKRSQKTPPKKPTVPFGWIRFSKTGKVAKETFLLPETKGQQEIEIAQRFTAHLNQMGNAFTCSPLPERDHDFMLVSQTQKIEVQQTSIVRRDYRRPVTQEELDGVVEAVAREDGSFDAINVAARDHLIVDRIRLKKAKHYPRPRDAELWLLITCLDAEFWFIRWEGGVRNKSPAIMNAEAYLSSHGAFPFDAIWFFYPLLNPYRLEGNHVQP